MTSGPKMPLERPAASGTTAAPRQELDHVAAVDRLGAVVAPRGQGDHRHALDQAHGGSGRSASAPDDDRGAQGHALVHRFQQQLLHLEPTGQVRRGPHVRRDQATEVDDPRHAGRAGGGGEGLRAPAVPIAEALLTRLHGVDEEVRHVAPLQRRFESVPRDDVAGVYRHLRLDARRIARERPHVVAVGEQARNERRADACPLAPVTSTSTADKRSQTAATLHAPGVKRLHLGDFHENPALCEICR